MKIANLAGRATLVFGDRGLDIERSSQGRFSADPASIYDHWDTFVQWARDAPAAEAIRFNVSDLGPPVPRPTQVFAIGINYAEHAAEAGYPPDPLPVTFTKFPTCLTGPQAKVALPSDAVDWEVELVVAISRRAERVERQDAWDHVAGLMVGQDLSERRIQMEGSKPQFSLGKSFPGFGPTGPWLVTLDEIPNPGDLEISCLLSGETVQKSRTSKMIYDIPELITRLSHVCPLLPGDLIFTGTPSGVGNARTPKRFIAPGDVLTSYIEGLGSMITTFSEQPTG